MFPLAVSLIGPLLKKGQAKAKAKMATIKEKRKEAAP
jgi:hypothetical protein